MRKPPLVQDKLTGDILDVKHYGTLVWKPSHWRDLQKRHGDNNQLNELQFFWQDDVVDVGTYYVMATGGFYTYYDGQGWNDGYKGDSYSFIFDDKCSITGEGVKIWQI